MTYTSTVSIDEFFLNSLQWNTWPPKLRMKEKTRAASLIVTTMKTSADSFSAQKAYPGPNTANLKQNNSAMDGGGLNHAATKNPVMTGSALGVNDIHIQ